jgi:hypothetical protein
LANLVLNHGTLFFYALLRSKINYRLTTCTIDD